MLKMSYYNFLIPIPEVSKFLIYNSLSNALIETEWAKGVLLSKWLRDHSELESEFDQLDENEKLLLRRDGIIIGIDVDEKETIRKRIAIKRQSMYENGILFLTINPTNQCNMNCLYCFEGDHQLKCIDDTSDHIPSESLLDLIRNEIKNPITKKIRGIHVSWFGGEPTLRPSVIEDLSKKLIDISEQHGFFYRAEIITNGTRLTPEMWHLFKKAQISRVQVSIDGCERTHNKKRPLRGKVKESHRLILGNVANMPQGFRLNLRINADKEVIKGLSELLRDLDAKDIWPHRAREVSLTLARKYYYPIQTREDQSLYFTDQEFFEAREHWREMQYQYYNDWASRNNKAPAQWLSLFPKDPGYFCSIASSPYGIAIDDKGYLHRCWEDMNDSTTKIQQVNEPFDITKPAHAKWLNFNMFEYNQECNDCKYFPICDQVCPKKHFEDRFECTGWKYLLETRLKSQYLRSLK